MPSVNQRLKELLTVEQVKAMANERAKHEYIAKVMEQKKHCGRSFFSSYKKLRDWCAFLEDYKAPKVLPTTLSPTTTHLISTAASKLNKSHIDIPNDTNNFLWPVVQNATQVVLGGGGTGSSAGYGFAGRKNCYDDFNCDTESLAHLNHYLLGIFALTFCVIGVLANTLCVPSFNIHANRSSATFYMTAIAVCDTLVLILCTLVYVMKNVPADYNAQQTVYKTFSGYLVPSAMPALELCELMSFWIVIALLVDRFFYLRNGFQSKAVCSRSLCAKVILTIFGCLVLYTAPKYLQYKVVEFEIKTPKNTPPPRSSVGSSKRVSVKPEFEIRNEVKVMLTLISKSDGYRNVMTHWLKVPVEMFVPMLILSGFTGYFLYKVVENRGAWYGQIKRNRHTPPAISNPLRTIVTERQVRQENVNILIALGVGLFVFACKMPKFVAHVLISETGTISPSFLLVVRFLDVLCAALKPALYLGVGDHLHRGIFGMFWSSCRAHEESAANEIALHLEMNNVPTVNLNSMIAAAANHTTTENGNPGAMNAEEYQPLNPTGDTGAGPIEGEGDNTEPHTNEGAAGEGQASVTINPSQRQAENKDINMTSSC